MNDSITGNNICLHHPGACPLVVGVWHDLHHPHLEHLGSDHVPTSSLVLCPCDSLREEGAGESVSQQDSSQSLLVSQQSLQEVLGHLGESLVCWSEDGEVCGPQSVHQTRSGGCRDQCGEPAEMERLMWGCCQDSYWATFHLQWECPPGHSQGWGRARLRRSG